MASSAWNVGQSGPVVDASHPRLHGPAAADLRYLCDEGFTTHIVSGGGVDFIRAIADDACGIPPAEVVGSEGKTVHEVVDGVPCLPKEGGASFVDHKEGKAVGIVGPMPGLQRAPVGGDAAAGTS